MNRNVNLGVASLGLLIAAGTLGAPNARRTPADRHGRRVCPNTVERYADLDLPAHFRTSAARRVRQHARPTTR